MKGNNSVSVFPLQSLIFTVMLTFLCCIFSACASGADRKSRRESLFTVASPQEAVYNGRQQAISYLYAGEGKPDIVYYASQRDRAEDRRGSRTAPLDAGRYYVRLIRPGTGKAQNTREFYAEFIILKRPVRIQARENQQAVYNGDPKRVQASAEPAVSLSFSYYPNRELLEAAKSSAADTPQGQSTITRTFRGYRRIETAPSEQGTYYVWIYFGGDKNHESASAEVEFTILPPGE